MSLLVAVSYFISAQRNYCFLLSIYSSVFTVTAPDLVACWCDVHRPVLHSASCCLGGRVSVLWDSQPRGWCPLRGHQRGLTLLTPIPVSTDMAVAQSPRAGHILRDTVICGHVYGPTQRGSVWQLETKRGGDKRQSDMWCGNMVFKLTVVSVYQLSQH